MRVKIADDCSIEGYDIVSYVLFDDKVMPERGISKVSVQFVFDQLSRVEWFNRGMDKEGTVEYFMDYCLKNHITSEMFGNAIDNFLKSGEYFNISNILRRLEKYDAIKDSEFNIDMATAEKWKVVDFNGDKRYMRKDDASKIGL